MTSHASNGAPNSTDVKIAIFPHGLPLELMRYIIELAANLDRKSIALTIALTSKLLRAWVDPLIYHTVALHTERGGDSFVAFLLSRTMSDPSFVPRRIKSISIMSSVSAENRGYIMSTCTGVSRVYLWTNSGLNSGGEEADDKGVTRMEFDTSHLLGLAHFSCSILPTGIIDRLAPSLTHVSLFYEDDLEKVDWTGLFRRCPALVHLLVTFPGDNREELDDFLSDGDIPWLARLIHKGHTDAGATQRLELVIIPHVLLTSAVLPVPVDWIALHSVRDATKVPQSLEPSEFLMLYPRTLLEEIDEVALEVILATAMDKSDVEMMLDDETLPFGYFMYRFPFIEDEVWAFARRAEEESMKEKEEKEKEKERQRLRLKRESWTQKIC